MRRSQKTEVSISLSTMSAASSAFARMSGSRPSPMCSYRLSCSNRARRVSFRISSRAACSRWGLAKVGGGRGGHYLAITYVYGHYLAITWPLPRYMAITWPLPGYYLCIGCTLLLESGAIPSTVLVVSASAFRFICEGGVK